MEDTALARRRRGSTPVAPPQYLTCWDQTTNHDKAKLPMTTNSLYPGTGMGGPDFASPAVLVTRPASKAQWLRRYHECHCQARPAGPALLAWSTCCLKLCQPSSKRASLWASLFEVRIQRARASGRCLARIARWPMFPPGTRAGTSATMSFPRPVRRVLPIVGATGFGSPALWRGRSDVPANPGPNLKHARTQRATLH